MYYSMKWYVRQSDASVVLMKVIEAMKSQGATVLGVGFYPEAIGLDFPFLMAEGSALPPPLLSLHVFQDDDPDTDVVVVLDCAIAIVRNRDRAEQNMRSMVTLGDAIYNSVFPYFGWGNDHTYESPTLRDFLETCLPVGAQFVYVGPELVDCINWAEMADKRFATVALADGGIRVENPGPNLPWLGS